MLRICADMTSFILQNKQCGKYFKIYFYFLNSIYLVVFVFIIYSYYGNPLGGHTKNKYGAKQLGLANDNW